MRPQGLAATEGTGRLSAVMVIAFGQDAASARNLYTVATMTGTSLSIPRFSS